jgi:ribosomal protein L32
VPALAFQPSCIAESESAVSEDGKSESVGEKLSEIFDGLLWTALPKKRVSRDRRRMRRHGENKIEKYATPRTNITACLECGHWHMIHTVCGTCKNIVLYLLLLVMF